MSFRLRAFLTLAALLPVAPVPARPAVLPPLPEAPVIGLRVLAPAGSRATFFPDGSQVVAYDTPVEVGVRPGYIYRFKLSDLPGAPDVALYPTVEVIGTLHMPLCIGSAGHPVPLVFSEEDIRTVLAGGFITKMIAIEHPDRAAPVATDRDLPIEQTLDCQVNLLEEAWRIGRPMVVVRLGQREVDLPQLQANVIPGTLQLPGQPQMCAPARPPQISFRCHNIADPILGLRVPDEECLKDGGDVPPRAAHDKEGNLYGLDPKDTVAEYTNSCGEKHISVSNRVCVCVPRYIVLKTELIPVGVDILVGPNQAKQVDERVVLQSRTPPMIEVQIDSPELLRNRERPQIMQEAVTAITYDQWLSTGLIVGDIGTQVVVGSCAKKCPPPDKPLLICKDVDPKCGAVVGDVVTFGLRYDNPGGQPIRHVVISDSLTGRLEYVPGSARSNRDAVFTTQDNVAGSVILRWELQGDLPPGQGGLITFQAKVR